MKIGLRYSSPLKYSKGLIGKSNHNLLTILISLDNTEISNDEDILIKEYASGKWKPNFKTLKSFPQAKIFASNATLAWTIDALDTYYRTINISPKLIQEKILEDKICAAKQSITKCHKAITEYYNDLSRFDCCILSLAITWRNNLIHHIADNDIYDEIKDELLNLDKSDKKTYYDLNIPKMIHNVESGKTPSYQELNAIIRTTIHFLESLDKKLISDLDINCYAISIYKHYFFKNYTHGENLVLSNFCKKNPDRKKSTLKRILMEYGFTEELPIKDASEEQIDNFSNFNYKEFFSFFKDNTK